MSPNVPSTKRRFRVVIPFLSIGRMLNFESPIVRWSNRPSQIPMEMITAFFLSLGSAILASVINVILSWLLLFRSATFRAQTTTLDKKKRQAEELREQADDGDDKTKAKKIKRLDDDIAMITKELSMKNMRFTIISGLFLFVFNRIIRSAFQGMVVARVPYEPIGFLARITHGGIETEDLRDGNFQFVYWLGSLLFRDVLTKWFGFQMPQLNLAQAFKVPQ
jgi:hypothetical protein